MKHLTFVEPLEPRIAPAMIVGGAIVFTDIDGDQVTVKVSKGSLSLPASATIVSVPGVAGAEQLQVLNLAQSAFQARMSRSPRSPHCWAATAW